MVLRTSYFRAGQLLEMSFYSWVTPYINPLKAKRRLLYLKSQLVPRSKHSSQL